MKIVITGASGQLGSALSTVLSSFELELLGHSDLDVTNQFLAQEIISRLHPDIVIHCAAMTDVDGCVKKPDRAFQVNAIGTRNVALACSACEATLLYVSTNEVFSGTASAPYQEWEPVHPINTYGCSKAAGEWFVQHWLSRFYIVRTAWLYAPGGRNFPHRILQLASERSVLHVVTDEIGNPTYVFDLARAIDALIRTKSYGVYHLTNAGYCSRYEFAQEILRLSGKRHVSIKPITLEDFSRLSTPPQFSALENIQGAKLGITLRPWKKALEEFLEKTT